MPFSHQMKQDHGIARTLEPLLDSAVAPEAKLIAAAYIGQSEAMLGNEMAEKHGVEMDKWPKNAARDSFELKELKVNLTSLIPDEIVDKVLGGLAAEYSVGSKGK